MFANGLENRGSISGRVIPKTQKMVLDNSLLNTQHYKVRIKGKVKQTKERSSVFTFISVSQLMKMKPLGFPRLRLPNLLIYLTRRLRADIIENLKIMNGISNYVRHFFQYLTSNWKFIAKTGFKNKSLNQLDFFC